MNLLQNFTQNVKNATKTAKFLFTKYPVNVFILIKDCLVNYLKYRIIGNSIRIDASNICQLSCPLCWQSRAGNTTLKRSYLKFDDFKKFIDNHPTFKNIEISDNGEIFLNPELKSIIKYAYEKRISLKAKNGVNLNTVSEEVLEYLVKYKFKVMLVSIDGATNESYQIYRRGGNFDRVIENIKKINYFKHEYNSKFPRLIWQFIIFGHNEKELPLAREMAKKLNMQFLPILNYFDPSYSPVRDKESIRKEIKYASCQEYENINRSLYVFPCQQLWFSPQISPDGEMLGCCNNNARLATFTFGNVFKSGLKKHLRSEKFIYTKKMLLGKKSLREDTLCFSCETYRKLQLPKINLIGGFLKILKRSI
ncbi:MAG: radical SAM protein [Candidatus Omnitrophica bacterium]|nr:radical SAM protein [Candidatus Omnitrophota bacterium]